MTKNLESGPVDLVIHGGRVVDPASGRDELADVAFAAGRVATVRPDLPRPAGTRVLDAKGCLVVPGLIDAHGHYFFRVTPFGADPDAVCLPVGVTTAVDAGSAGWADARALLDTVCLPSRARVLAFLNLSAVGMLPAAAGVGEFSDPALSQPERAVAALGAEPERFVGIKLRVDSRVAGPQLMRQLLAQAVEVTQTTGTRLMVHLVDSPLAPEEVLAVLRPGDILTHVYDGGAGLIGEDGKVQPAFLEARARGILFDLGHAGVHTFVPVARAAVAAGFWPDTLGSDYHLGPPDRAVYDTATLVSFMEGVGMPFSAALAAATSQAARALGRDRDLGALQPGFRGDAAVFEVEEGSFELFGGRDHRTYREADHVVVARRRLRTRFTVVEGEVRYQG